MAFFSVYDRSGPDWSSDQFHGVIIREPVKHAYLSLPARQLKASPAVHVQDGGLGFSPTCAKGKDTFLQISDMFTPYRAARPLLNHTRMHTSEKS